MSLATLPISLVAFLKFVSSPITHHIGYLVKSRKKVQDLEVDVGRLKARTEDLNREITDADRNGMVPTSQVGGWIRRARTKLMKLLRTRARTIDALEGNVKKVRDCLNNDAFGTIGILGMGGVGKTTLMTYVNNLLLKLDEFINERFSKILWITVSKDLNIKRIRKEIGRQLGLKLDVEDEEMMVDRLFSTVKKQRFLLILDDVWAMLDIDNIRVPPPDAQNKCKVIITTRKIDVCNQMGTDTNIKVDILQNSEAWGLFCEKATRVVDLPAIKPHAEAVVKECGGLPLAITTVGSAMRRQRSIAVWKNALQALREASTEIEGMESKVYLPLKFSYEALKVENIKECFLYCSLAHSWKFKSRGCKKQRPSYKKLIGSCMLQRCPTSERRVKLHDVICDLAVWIGSSTGKFVVEAGLGLMETRKLQSRNRIERLPNQPVCPRITTLLLQDNITLSSISSGFFEFMGTLKVLDLRGTVIQSLPPSLSNLRNLRCLLLSDCYRLVDIPLLQELKHLQSLNLRETKIERLPQGLEELVNLNYLDLEGTQQLKIFEHGMISRLTCLEEVNIFECGFKEWKLEGDEEHRSDDTRYQDRKVKRGEGSWAANWEELDEARIINKAEYKEIFVHVRKLELVRCQGLMNIDHLPHMTCLKTLFIESCLELESLVLDLAKWHLEGDDLKSVHHNLKMIVITSCNGLKNVLLSAVLPCFLNLQCVCISEMEEMISGVVEEKNVLHNLIWLDFRKLPKLKSIFIYVNWCPKWKKLHPGLEEAKNLGSIMGSLDWWKGLEWEDEHAKSTLQPLFESI
ncbi:hypothetical protein AMTRI_Chr02g214680 [Amborella trichopoda]